MGLFGVNFSFGDRLIIAKLITAKFSDLHALKIAHRDVTEHCIWLSPSKEVALSSFISAYHQPLGTVGDYRKAISVGAYKAEDILEEAQLSPFQQDVHALALVIWHLLCGKRMSPNSLQNIEKEILESEEWYANVILQALEVRFCDAGEFFDALKQAEPSGEAIPTFDVTELEPFRFPISHSRQYREDDDFIVETEEKEVYLSNGRLIKAWLGVGVQGDDPVADFHVLRFLKLVQKLKASQPVYIPKIHDFGIASKSSSLYLVTDYVKGITWREFCELSAEIDDETKLGFIKRFVADIEHLHEMGMSHGDLHPENVIVDKEGMSLYLVDIPDFSPTGDELKNHRYSPENIDAVGAGTRDNFAVMRMSSELLGVEWGSTSEKYADFARAIQTELDDTHFGFKDLARFSKAVETICASDDGSSIQIRYDKVNELTELLPDNGRLYLSVERNQRLTHELIVTFSGIGGSLKAVYCEKSKVFLNVLKLHTGRTSIRPHQIRDSQLEINNSIQVIPGRPQDLSALTIFLNQHEAFLRVKEDLKLALQNAQQVEPESPPEDELTLQLRNAFTNLPEDEDKHEAQKTVSENIEIATDKLWQAILDTETESSPSIVLDSDVIKIASRSGELILPYSGELDPLDEFNQDDDVTALYIDGEVERILGEVSLAQSALKSVYLKNVRSAAYKLTEFDTVYFRSRQDRSSFRKRKKALKRLLSRQSVIPDLIDYFDPNSDMEPFDLGIEITEQDFARYEREDERGNKISLNQQQRAAFSKLVNNGPLSMLQGPPGTGKTEFIAAFVHYLIEKQNASRILLVSQSHEAVNTAAERIRKHCSRLNTELEVVRFSNREGAVSNGLKDVYSNAITSGKRELFNAEIKYRVESLADALGLEPELISSAVIAELKLFKKIDHYDSLLEQLKSIDHEDEESQLQFVLKDLDRAIREDLLLKYKIDLRPEEAIQDAKYLVTSKLCREYAVTPDEFKRVKSLANITSKMIDALAGERVSLDEFYARSRQLVAGTCVGIGQAHIGISENIYDWVIIDEAARSISSELAIAMQSARRVLLVGDHLQLPPLYSESHKDALARKLGINCSRNELETVLQSDFARAFESNYGALAGAALLTQYRMAPAIGNLVARTFYGKQGLENGLRSIPDIYKNVPTALQNVVTWLDTSEHGLKSLHSHDKGVSIYNRFEADQIISLLKKIHESTDLIDGLNQHVSDGEAAIGVICMYAEQKRIIRQKFNQELWSDGFKGMVKIDTVDSYQGKENRIIILSLTRSDKQCSPGFLKAPNRINVAMSRAMDRLIIVGNKGMWTGKNQSFPLGRVVQFMNEEGPENGYSFINLSAKGVK